MKHFYVLAFLFSLTVKKKKKNQILWSGRRRSVVMTACSEGYYWHTYAKYIFKNSIFSFLMMEKDTLNSLNTFLVKEAWPNVTLRHMLQILIFICSNICLINTRLLLTWRHNIPDEIKGDQTERDEVDK